MTCYKPLKAYRSRTMSERGRYEITFNPVKGLIEGSSIELPCGKCIGCRIDRSRQWAARCMHEAQMHPENSFITLTYSDEHLPEDGSISLPHWQKFMYRLRRSLAYHSNKKVRFFAAGEYGETTFRPHYHALIFNHQFSDKKLYSTKRNIPLYVSESLQSLWPYGHTTVGNVTYQSAAYVARYCMKKVGGEQAADHYLRPHPITGKLNQVRPEFCVMSRKPGIGSSWFDAYQGDAFPSDFIIVDGKKHPVPKFYLNRLQEDEQTAIKRKRKAHSLKHREHQTPERLAVREKLKTQQLKQLQRDLK